MKEFLKYNWLKKLHIYQVIIYVYISTLRCLIIVLHIHRFLGVSVHTQDIFVVIMNDKNKRKTSSNFCGLLRKLDSIRHLGGQ